jgi:trehalose utilization protein
MNPPHVTIFNEFVPEQTNDFVKKIYPGGMHLPIAHALKKHLGAEARIATLDMPEHGLTEEVMRSTDVLVWWGHVAHHKVDDAIVDRVHNRVLDGMGLVVLHSGHFSKIFKRLMGTSCGLCWREAAEKERLWVVSPNHPITQGVPACIELPHEEMYGEHFDIPDPDELLFVSWFEGGEIFRSGAVWHRGKGRIFYFRPGHETYPSFHNPQVLQVIANGVRWAQFCGNSETLGINNCIHVATPLEPISEKNYAQGVHDLPEEFLDAQ